MRLLLIAVVVVGCGGPNANTKSGWLETNANSRKWCTSECDKGNLQGCTCEADALAAYPTNHAHTDWGADNSYQLDRAKAKQLHQRACEHPGITRTSSCRSLVSEGLLTTEEALEYCKTNQEVCDALALDLKVSEDVHYQLAMNNPSEAVCSMAVPTVNEKGKSAEVTMVCGLWTIQHDAELTIMVAEHDAAAAADDDDDDDAPAHAAPAADSACHKDTECKGDRICQAGNCVDAKPSKGGAKETAKAPEGPFKLPACDAFAALYESRIAHCAPLKSGKAPDQYKYMNRDFPDLPKDRYESVGARCTQAISNLEPLLTKLKC